MTFDQYATSAHWQVLRSFSGLPAGQHRITVTVLGTKTVASSAASVPVDGFVVHG